MKIVKSILSTLFLSLLVMSFGHSQELLAKVKVIAPTLQTADKSIVTQLERNITEFLNNQRWTNDQFDVSERIRCNLILTIRKDLGNNNFSIDFAVQSSRPVFKSNYESTLINIMDRDVPIYFDPFKPLENSKETYFDNLSSIMTYYAYLIIAMDYDSFSPKGGDPYITILDNMINTMPSNARGFDSGWKPSNNNGYNRFNLLDDIKNTRMAAFRRAYYEYHRLCLDTIEKDRDNARKNLATAIEDIASADQAFQGTRLIQIFVAAKKNEIIEIFKQGTISEKLKIYTAMTQMDPSNNSEYNVLKS